MKGFIWWSDLIGPHRWLSILSGGQQLGSLRHSQNALFHSGTTDLQPKWNPLILPNHNLESVPEKQVWWESRSLMFNVDGAGRTSAAWSPERRRNGMKLIVALMPFITVLDQLSDICVLWRKTVFPPNGEAGFVCVALKPIELSLLLSACSGGRGGGGGGVAAFCYSLQADCVPFPPDWTWRIVLFLFHFVLLDPLLSSSLFQPH